ncbi:hypothetical protein NPM17_24615, partial [Escherichia coli]|nr:hypothetical protein [Escherichia coli]
VSQHLWFSRQTKNFFFVTRRERLVELAQRNMAGKLTYQQAGVDTRKAAALVGDIGTHVRRTQQTRKLWGAFGLFAACYDLSSYKEPVMMTGCDGVGTKLELLLEHDLLETAGKDLVAMSVAELRRLGLALDPHDYVIERHRGAMPQPAPGHRERMAQLAATLNGTGLHVGGAGIDGAGVGTAIAAGRRLARHI